MTTDALLVDKQVRYSDVPGPIRLALEQCHDFVKHYTLPRCLSDRRALLIWDYSRR
jgi:hypothetical protein